MYFIVLLFTISLIINECLPHETDTCRGDTPTLSEIKSRWNAPLVTVLDGGHQQLEVPPREIFDEFGDSHEEFAAFHEFLDRVDFGLARQDFSCSRQTIRLTNFIF